MWSNLKLLPSSNCRKVEKAERLELKSEVSQIVPNSKNVTYS